MTIAPAPNSLTTTSSCSSLSADDALLTTSSYGFSRSVSSGGSARPAGRRPPIYGLARDVMRIIFRCFSRNTLARISTVSTVWRSLVHSDVDLVDLLYNGNTTPPSSPPRGACFPSNPHVPSMPAQPYSLRQQGWESLGTPDYPFPEPLLKWLAVNDGLKRPLPLQQLIVGPLALGIDAVLECQPLSGVTTSAFIAALWRAVVSRLPQHLAVFCSVEALPSTMATVRKVLCTLPLADADSALRIVITRQPRERMGLKFNDGTLILKSVNRSRVAHGFGADKFVGKRLTHVNGKSVETLEQVSRMVANQTAIQLRFESRGIAAGVWWDERRYVCGGKVQDVPFTVSLSAVDENGARAGGFAGAANLTLRFCDEKKPKRLWCNGIFRKQWGHRETAKEKRDKKKRQSAALLDSLSADGEHLLDEYHGEAFAEVTIKTSPSERLGIKFQDGTLVLKSVNPSLRAHRHGVARFTGRRLTHVNGIPVKTLDEVKDVVSNKTTILTVEQADRTGRAAARHVCPPVPPDDRTPFVAVFAAPTPFECPMPLRAPIRACLPHSAEHYYVSVSASGDELDALENWMCDLAIHTIVVCCQESSVVPVSRRVGGVAVTAGASPLSLAGERIFVASASSLHLVPRADLVVVLSPTETSCHLPPHYPPVFYFNAMSHAGVPASPNKGASVTFLK
ncbi:hypothetical protein DIPPA_19026, partial [Diplonema papillatum]|eukprot:gene19395-29878_t